MPVSHIYTPKKRNNDFCQSVAIPKENTYDSLKMLLTETFWSITYFLLSSYLTVLDKLLCSQL